MPLWSIHVHTLSLATTRFFRIGLSKIPFNAIVLVMIQSYNEDEAIENPILKKKSFIIAADGQTRMNWNSIQKHISYSIIIISIHCCPGVAVLDIA